MTTSQWARWKWSDIGFGRWHVLAEQRSDGAVTGCGSKRHKPALTAPRPKDSERVCPKCARIDDLRLRYQKRSDADQPIKTPAEPVLAGAQ